MKWEAGPGGKEAADLSPDVSGPRYFVVACLCLRATWGLRRREEVEVRLLAYRAQVLEPVASFEACLPLTLNPQPSTLNPKPYTPNPKP